MFWCIDPNVYFTLEFYGTSNTKSKKELQIWVRCWSENEKKIVSRHLITYFLGHATGEIWFEHLIKALDTNSLRLEQVLTLGRDGTNTNKKVVRLCQEKLKGLGLKLLFDSGSCKIHIAHNSYLQGLNCLSVDILDLIIKVYYLFHNLRC